MNAEKIITVKYATKIVIEQKVTFRGGQAFAKNKKNLLKKKNTHYVLGLKLFLAGFFWVGQFSKYFLGGLVYGLFWVLLEALGIFWGIKFPPI